MPPQSPASHRTAQAHVLMAQQPDPALHQAALQAITPELRSWIVEQAQAGFAVTAMLQSMRTAGWQEDVALYALEHTLREHVAQMPPPQLASATAQVATDAASTAVRPAATHAATVSATLLASGEPVPAPALANAPTLLDGGDRQVKVLLHMSQPPIVVLGDLLSDEECEALIAAAAPRMARSQTVAVKTGGEEINSDRTSDGMFFQRGESPLLERIEARIAKLLNWPLENGEGLQVLHYQPGAEYKPHYDYFDPAEPGTPSIVRRGGQRVGTLVMYLNTPEQGGGTTFPDVHLQVAAQRGNAVFFSYDQPHPGTLSLHGGAPVIAGDKWIATKWLRQREFK